MDKAQIYQTLSLICFGVGGVCFLTAIFLFFKLNIPAVIGELTGRTARRQIAAYQKGTENKKTVEKEEEEAAELPHIFQMEEKKEEKKGTGETVLLIDPGTETGEEKTVLLDEDVEDDERTEVMDPEFRIVREETHQASKKIV